MSPLQREADDGAPATTQRRKAASHLLPNATGGVRLGSTLLSGLAAGVAEPRVLRCVLCQVSLVISSYAHVQLSGPNCYNPAPFVSLLLDSEQCLNCRQHSKVLQRNSNIWLVLHTAKLYCNSRRNRSTKVALPKAELLRTLQW